LSKSFSDIELVGRVRSKPLRRKRKGRRDELLKRDEEEESRRTNGML